MDTVKFTQMKDGDREDYAHLLDHEIQYAAETSDRLLSAMIDLDKSLSGYKVTRLEHSLQSATRAWRDGADIDWVVSALLHDIGDIYAPYNHDEYAAAILRPFVREQCAWVVEKHGDFQLLYYGAHVGADPNKRTKYSGHPYYPDCADFCEKWDQASFDPDYPSEPLSFFAPLVKAVFSRAAYDPSVVQPGVRLPLSETAPAQRRLSGV